MRMYKEINRVIKNYILLKYNNEIQYKKDATEFKLYLSNLMDIFKQNKIILDYSIELKHDEPELNGFELIYLIDNDNTFAMHFTI